MVIAQRTPDSMGLPLWMPLVLKITRSPFLAVTVFIFTEGGWEVKPLFLLIYIDTDPLLLRISSDGTNENFWECIERDRSLLWPPSNTKALLNPNSFKGFHEIDEIKTIHYLLQRTQLGSLSGPTIAIHPSYISIWNIMVELPQTETPFFLYFLGRTANNNRSPDYLLHSECPLQH